MSQNRAGGEGIVVAPLTAAAFAPFGSVITAPAAGGRSINAGTALRFDDIAELELTAERGRPQLSVFRVSPWPAPIAIAMLERHPLSTQSFVPMTGRPFLVIVAAAGDAPVPGTCAPSSPTGVKASAMPAACGTIR